MPIYGIFYARFLPDKGTKIVAQSPPGCIVPMAAADESESESGGIGGIGGFGVGPQPGSRDSHDDSSDDGSDDGSDGSDDSHGQDHKGASSSKAGGKQPAASAILSGSGRGHQTPRGKALFDFDVMQEYVIPRPAFFNRYLAALEPSGRFAVLGLPVAIRNSKYDRNAFIFNFGIVVDSGDDQGPYEQVVRRLASTFAEMEKQNEFLSREEQREQRSARGGGPMGGPSGGDVGSLGVSMASLQVHRDETSAAAAGRRRGGPTGTSTGTSMGTSTGTSTGRAAETPLARYQRLLGTTAGSGQPHSTQHHPSQHGPYHRRSIQSLLEIIKEDLNLYGECMIPVDDANTINMKLFPQHADPPAVEGWHVPVPKMRLAEVVDPSWDLTLQRVIAHMDGVADVRRIAHEADVSLELCRAALRHLMYYDTILLLDLFFFGSCYAPRPGIQDFVANVGGIVDECARYVCLGPYSRRPDRRPGDGFDHDGGGTGTGTGTNTGIGTSAADHNDPAGQQAPYHRQPRVNNFDLIRLMTSFCVGRTVSEWLKGHADSGFDVLRYVDVRRLVQFGVIKGCLYRVHKYAVSKQYLASLVTGQAAPQRPVGSVPVVDDPLQRYTDGNHHFDQIMTELNLTEVEILEQLKHFPQGDVRILYR